MNGLNPTFSRNLGVTDSAPENDIPTRALPARFASRLFQDCIYHRLDDQPPHISGLQAIERTTDVIESRLWSDSTRFQPVSEDVFLLRDRDATYPCQKDEAILHLLLQSNRAELGDPEIDSKEIISLVEAESPALPFQDQIAVPVEKKTYRDSMGFHYSTQSCDSDQLRKLVLQNHVPKMLAQQPYQDWWRATWLSVLMGNEETLIEQVQDLLGHGQSAEVQKLSALAEAAQDRFTSVLSGADQNGALAGLKQRREGSSALSRIKFANEENGNVTDDTIAERFLRKMTQKSCPKTILALQNKESLSEALGEMADTFKSNLVLIDLISKQTVILPFAVDSSLEQSLEQLETQSQLTPLAKSMHIAAELLDYPVMIQDQFGTHLLVPESDYH